MAILALFLRPAGRPTFLTPASVAFLGVDALEVAVLEVAGAIVMLCESNTVDMIQFR